MSGEQSCAWVVKHVAEGRSFADCSRGLPVGTKAFRFKPLAVSESLSLSFPFWKEITSLTAWQSSWELSDIRAYECGTALKVTKAQGKGEKKR